MNLKQFERILRVRWLTVTLTFITAVLGAIGLTMLTTPLYESSTKLFVSTTAGASAFDLYQGNRLSQDRVLSYTQLLMGRTLAQRTVSKHGLDMSAVELQEKVKATSKPDTVLIDVKVRDESPSRARYLADALSDEFVLMVRELETPRPGADPDARVVVQQRALFSAKPAVPDPLRNIAAGVALGGFVAVGLALLKDRLDNTVKDRDGLERITGVGLVGSIPYDKTLRSAPLVPFGVDKSATAETFRKLRTNLQFLSVDDPARLILVTSSVPQEGKTTTAVNLARALAEAEHEVLLLDGDMRRPSVDKFLGLVGSVGFSTVLSGGASLSEALQETKLPHLTVLASGPTPPNPSELLGSMAARKVLDELRGRFDYVIIDTAPVLAVADTAVLAAISDGALMITRFGDTRRDQVASAVRTLGDVGATLLGSVLTMTPMSKLSHSYYSHYYGAGTRG